VPFADKSKSREESFLKEKGKRDSMMSNNDLFTLYRARYVMPMAEPLIEDGAVIVRDGIIAAVGKYQDLRGRYSFTSSHDLGEVILMPGLINAHAHLDYTMMRNQLTPGTSFTTWIQQLNKIKFSLSEQDFLRAIFEGVQELYAWGCTTICNIESFPNLLFKVPKLPLRLYQFFEVIDIRSKEQGREGIAMMESFFKKKTRAQCGFGVSPHAPYTSSQSLYRSAAQLARKYEIPFCTHLAESQEENEMFTQKKGLLYEFLKNGGYEMCDYGFQTPLQVLLKNNLLPRGSMLVHMNFLSDQDRLLLAPRGHDFFIIHCPKTHHFFERPPFDWKFFYHNEFPLLLGTDSLASNDSLNLFEEMQSMVATAPELRPEAILKMVTLHPAAAIGMKGRLGELSAGAFADMIAIPFLGRIKNVSESVIENRLFPKVI
jgi:cytosine/adenosine deaminase-related metal-dependent hydrolase